jgi:hypothetical protein
MKRDYLRSTLENTHSVRCLSFLHRSQNRHTCTSNLIRGDLRHPGVAGLPLKDMLPKVSDCCYDIFLINQAYIDSSGILKKPREQSVPPMQASGGYAPQTHIPQSWPPAHQHISSGHHAGSSLLSSVALIT